MIGEIVFGLSIAVVAGLGGLSVALAASSALFATTIVLVFTCAPRARDTRHDLQGR